MPRRKKIKLKWPINKSITLLINKNKWRNGDGSNGAMVGKKDAPFENVL